MPENDIVSPSKGLDEKSVECNTGQIKKMFMVSKEYFNQKKRVQCYLVLVDLHEPIQQLALVSYQAPYKR